MKSLNLYLLRLRVLATTTGDSDMNSIQKADFDSFLLKFTLNQCEMENKQVFQHLMLAVLFSL